MRIHVWLEEATKVNELFLAYTKTCKTQHYRKQQHALCPGMRVHLSSLSPWGWGPAFFSPGRIAAREVAGEPSPSGGLLRPGTFAVALPQLGLPPYLPLTLKAFACWRRFSEGDPALQLIRQETLALLS